MVELLAPAGDFEALKAAVLNGADAVYLGGKEFSARQEAGNFDKNEIVNAIKFCHAYGVKVYVTLNTLIKDEEMERALEYASFLYEQGADALIIQDYGLLKLLKENIPDFEIHASTQMSVNNLEGVNFLYSQGVKRVVLPRELSLKEIEYIAKNTQAEIEVFVHGALCISFSGQCLFSSILGGRSGNRGRCAQPCRMLYSFDGDKKYILSPKDLSTIDCIDKIVKAGVKSLKIEGRMKRPEYVATVVSAYRKAIDGIADEKDKEDVVKIFNRGGFTSAYLFDNIGPEMMSYENPKNWGVYLGKVVGKKGKFIYIKLERDLNIGDGIEVFGKGVGVPVNTIYDEKGAEIKKGQKGEIVKIYFEKAQIGDIIYKTLDIKLIEKARKSYEGKDVKKVPLLGRFKATLNGMEFEVEGSKKVKVTMDGVEKAISKPTTKERIIEALSKTGDTPFYFENIDVFIEDNLMIPISKLNAIRRQAIDELLDKIQGKRDKVNINISFKNKEFKVIPKIVVKTGRMDVALASLKSGADLVFFGSDLRIDKGDIENLLEYKEKVFPHFPDVIIEEYDFYKDKAKRLYALGFKKALCGNLGLYKDLIDIGYEVYLDKSFNILNSFSTLFLENEASYLSHELNMGELKNLISNTDRKTMVFVYGRTRLMISRHCIIGSSKGYFKKSCPNACESKIHYIKDRLGEKFLVVTDYYCRSHIYNSKKTIMLEHIKDLLNLNADYWILEFLEEDKDQVESIVYAYKDALLRGINKDFSLSKKAKEILEINKNNITKGHFYRGIL
ncbi:putative protease [Caloramator fervidus]|uniref:Putative protease n=1 Tax=Caloramator fervidus TaxID=29344 RepID=A0A1H5U6D9_9CLOT|nr:U32 family peptidase [Caloramator fervidus]SEF70549.1 putative protease [Caloramator fervidus]